MICVAKVKLTLPDDLMKKLSQLEGNSEEVLMTSVSAGGDAALPIVKARLESVVGKSTKYQSRSTGELARSIGVTGARRNSKGIIDVKIGFAGTRPDGKRNGMIAGVLEYGKHGQTPHPFIKPSKSKAKKAAQEAMVKKFDEEVAKYVK